VKTLYSDFEIKLLKRAFFQKEKNNFFGFTRIFQEACLLNMFRKLVFK